VDILRKTDTAYDFYEVKNAPEVKEQFVKDAGFQLYLLTRCGVKVEHVFIIYHGPDPSSPFVTEDITSRAIAYVKWVNEHIWNLNRIKKQPEEFLLPMGSQCSDPYECWYCDYCRQLEENAQFSLF